MKRTLNFIFWIFLANVLVGQTNEITVPLHPDIFSDQIFDKLCSGELRSSRSVAMFAAIGDYKNALTIGNEFPIEFGFDSIRQTDLDYYDNFTDYQARSEIISLSKNYRLILIQESHHKPQHRIFTKGLLAGLYENGYRYLALEALAHPSNFPIEFRDTLLEERGYPLNNVVTGVYIQEPQMSNLIREALKLGFKIIAYDGIASKIKRPREEVSAERLAKIFNDDPEAKIIVHCGGYHILETPDIRGNEWLGLRLKKLTGIDPLTINQDILTERSTTLESPFYKMMDFIEPKVFKNSNNEYYNGFKDFESFDILVFHPRTTYILNRPNWLLEKEEKKMVEIKDINVEMPCLIKAYDRTDKSDAVPIDMVEKRFKDDLVFLVLGVGEYRIEVINQKGIKQTQLLNVD